MSLLTRRPRFAVAAAAVALFTTTTAQAQDAKLDAQSSAAADEARAAIAAERESAGAIVLTLEDAVALALRQNLDLHSDDISRRASEARAESPKGSFDWLFSAFYQDARNVSPQASSLSSSGSSNVSVSTTDNVNLTFSKLFRYGGQLDLATTAFRRETNEIFSTFDPSLSANVTITYKQSLLRGRGRELTELLLTQARNTAVISDHSFRMRAESTVKDAVDAYWELAGSEWDLQVQRTSLALAEKLLEQNRIMVRVGTLAPIEIATSEAEVAQRNQDIITSHAALKAGADGLRRLLGIPEDSPWWNVPIRAGDPIEPPEIEVDLQESIERALQNRVELKSAGLRVANSELDVKRAKNDLKPRLDFEGSISSAGLTGDGAVCTMPLVPFVTDPFDPTQCGDVEVFKLSRGDTYGDIVDREFNSWTLQLTYSQPIFNRQAKADHLAARLDLDRQKLAVDQQRQTIILEVRAAVRDVETSRQSIVAAQANMLLQEKKVDAEIKKFENGMSTNFEVLQAQRDLSAARSSVIRAVVNYRKALAALDKARGSSLSEGQLALARRS